MNALDLIKQEVISLLETQRAEVLDFIGYLKSRYATEDRAVSPEERLADLMAYFAPYRKDFGDFLLTFRGSIIAPLLNQVFV
ncbi:hypothetical protein Thiowin_04575 [Thiorhodovibrio winogradskyi]|uniref:DUF2281 domain-containing protein n=1 Tax=Thiorhodovibrio winogradskyi TaxID=77007 RepID=A0ABZ0SEH0_9GAMM|nr:hypothetical protein [Thiorhodovibrio winogradskyi]